MYPNFPPNQSGYPPNSMPGYPPQQQGYDQGQQFGGGYPPQQPYGMPPAGAYPPQQAPYGQQYPPQQPGYPQQGSMPGYEQAGQPTYPPQPQQQYGAPPAGAYPPQAQYGQQQAPYGQFPQQQQMPPAGNAYQQTMGQQYAPQHGYGQQAAQPQTRPTVVAAPNFNASNDAAALRKAMKGFGTDEDAIIEVLCRRTNAQRMEICRTFKTAYGKDLLDDIRSECRANFLSVLIALLTPLTEYYARELYEAMYGEGTDEDVLIEVMCGLSNREIRAINIVYGHIFGKTLEDALREDTSGCFKRIMVSLSTGNRDESMHVDMNAARLDAEALKNAGIARMGTDESEFNRILCLRNFEHIKQVAREYEQLTGHTLEKDIKKEFSGDIEDALVAVLRVALNRSEFFARRLHMAMAGLGTNDRDLIRLVVTRCEVDMVDIKEEFQKKYGKPLKSFIKGDTSGDYKHALYALIGENRS